MNEWGVFLVIVALIGFVVSVSTPIIKLNTKITTLIVTLENLGNSFNEVKGDIKEQKLDAAEEHEKLWHHNHKQDATLNDHEYRIKTLEGGK